MGEIAIGQIWRDTYDHSLSIPTPNARTVRVLSKEPDGRWLVEVLTEIDGSPVKRARKSRISEKTFRSGYALQGPRP
jgi:hypothetical protein